MQKNGDKTDQETALEMDNKSEIKPDR